MLRFSHFLATAAAGFGVALGAGGALAATDDPGTPCGDNMVMNTNQECVAVGSVCTMTDGMIVGTIGVDGRCVIPGMNP